MRSLVSWLASCMTCSVSDGTMLDIGTVSTEVGTVYSVRSPNALYKNQSIKRRDTDNQHPVAFTPEMENYCMYFSVIKCV